MVMSCVAFGCTNRAKRRSQIQFFRFPLNDPDLLEKWLVAAGREDYTPKAFSKLCSAHFTDDDFLDRPNANFSRLKPDAVPSVFPISLIFEEKESPAEPKLPLDKPLPSTSASASDRQIILDVEESIRKVRNELKYKKFLEKLENLGGELTNTIELTSQTNLNAARFKVRLAAYRKKIRCLHQKLRRRNRTIENLKNLVRRLKDEGLIDEDFFEDILQEYSDSEDEAAVDAELEKELKHLD